MFSNHLLPSIKDEDKSCMAVLHVFESFCCVSVSLCRFPVGLSFFFFMLRAPVIKAKIFWKTNGRFPSVEMTSLREGRNSLYFESSVKDIMLCGWE